MDSKLYISQCHSGLRTINSSDFTEAQGGPFLVVQYSKAFSYMEDIKSLLIKFAVDKDGQSGYYDEEYSHHYFSSPLVVFPDY